MFPSSGEPLAALRRGVARHLLLTASLGYAALFVLTYWPYIRGGPGIFSDSWAALAAARWDERSLGSQAAACFNGSATRPTSCLLQIGEVGIVGQHPSLWFAVGAVILVASALLVAWIIRAVGMPIWVGILAGAALIVLPSANAVRLWPINGAALGLCLLLGSVAVGIRAVRESPGPLHRWALAGLSVLLFAAAIGAYEALAFLVLIAIVPLLLVAKERRAGFGLWGAYLVVVALFAVFRLSSSVGAPVQTTIGIRERFIELLRAGLTVWFQSVVPAIGSWEAFLAATLILVAVVVVVVSLRASRRQCARSIGLFAVGLAVIVAGVLPYLATDRWYTPRLVGTDNRVNLATQLGYALGLAAIAAMMFTAFAGAQRLAGQNSSPWRVVIPGLATAALFLPLTLHAVHENRFQQRDWLLASDELDLAFSRLQSLLADPTRKPPSAVYLFDVGGVTPNWVPAVGWWEASNMAKLIAGLSAPAAGPYVAAACAATGIRGKKDTVVPSVGYGDFVFMNVRTGRVATPQNRSECLSYVRSNAPAREFI